MKNPYGRHVYSKVFVAEHLCHFSFPFSSFCQSYDMKQHSTKVFRDIVNALGSFIQSLFIVPNAGNPAAVNAPAGQFSYFTVSSDQCAKIVLRQFKHNLFPLSL